MNELKNRLAALLSVKSMVTLILTVVFAWLSLRGQIGQDFMTVYTVVIAFYFGTQSRRDGSRNTDIPRNENASVAAQSATDALTE